MSEQLTTLLALFKDIDPAADAIDKLREMGIVDEQMNVVSGIPVMERVLGRPKQWKGSLSDYSWHTAHPTCIQCMLEDSRCIRSRLESSSSLR
jgi:hypothetical protein